MEDKKEQYNRYVDQRKQLLSKKAAADAETDQLTEQITDIDIEMGLLLKEIEGANA